MRYNANDYFFVQEKDVVTIVHGVRPDQEGMDMSKKRIRPEDFSVEMNKVAAKKARGTSIINTPSRARHWTSRR